MAGPEETKNRAGRVVLRLIQIRLATPSLAKIYRAPRSMVGKVFTIYFTPSDATSRSALTLSPGFKRCVEERDRTGYYFVSDAGVAYRFLRDGDRLEMVIYQPSRAEVRSLAVSTECVF